MLAERRWPQLEATAARLPPADLTRLLDGLCLTDAYAQALAGYQQSGSSDLRRLTAGVHATFVAWQIRGGAYAKYTSSEQLAGFTQQLERAFGQLRHSFAAPAYQAEAAARLVRVAMGLSEPDLARQALKQATALVPDHLQAHLFYFNVLTPKWFGDEEQLEHFVTVEAAPALRPLLLAMYAVELLYNASEGTALVRQQVRNELAPQLRELLASGPLPGESLHAVYFNNYLAALHYALKQPAARDSFLQMLGPRITPYPWAYYGLLDAPAVQGLVQTAH